MNKIISVEEFSEVIRDGIVLIDFYSDSCVPCKGVERILKEYEDKVRFKIYSVDVDEFSELATQYNVVSLPTLIMFKNGILVDYKVGFDRNGIMELIKFWG